MRLLPPLLFSLLLSAGALPAAAGTIRDTATESTLPCAPNMSRSSCSVAEKGRSRHAQQRSASTGSGRESGRSGRGPVA